MTFEKLIEELGAKLGVEIENAGGAAAMEIDGMFVVLQDAGELLLLRAEVGDIPKGGKAAILSSAMEANFLYQGTGGATLAVNPSDGRLHIHKYNWMDRLDGDALLDALDRLADSAAAWRKILADYRPDAAVDDMSPSGGLDRNGLDEGAFMQV